MPTVRTDLLAEGIRDLEVAPTGYFARNQVGGRGIFNAVSMRPIKFTFDGWDVTIQSERDGHIKATITGRHGGRPLQELRPSLKEVKLMY